MSQINKVICAGGGAVVFYVAWYGIRFGHFCPAMWFGTAPPVIMGVVFFTIFGFLNNYRD